MDKIRIDDIEGEKFPAGRWTRVITGDDKIKPERFMMGYVVIYPGGKVPEHEHENEEVYTVLKGQGEMVIGDNRQSISAMSAVYIPPGSPHSLINTGEEDLEMMFVYAPATIVDHWEQEKKGELT
jgi:mannose-6-phosphate isomerase-like protein (cupin superfamily)